ncbi:hypothetical protein RI367_000485 [Sorochytrium milnesiophthora]
MKGVIRVRLDDGVEVYVKASNLQGTMEVTKRRKSWDEAMRKQIGYDGRCIKIKDYSMSPQGLQLRFELEKDTLRHSYDLLCRQTGDNTYEGDMYLGWDPFTPLGVIRELVIWPFVPLLMLADRVKAYFGSR